MAMNGLLPTISMAVTFTLGSGTRHRWYDVRATMNFSFKSMNKHNPDFALFEVAHVQPENFRDRALEKWRSMSARGLDPAFDPLISDGDNSYTIRLKTLVPADGAALWCDWSELLTAWCRQERLTSWRREPISR